MKVLLLFQQHQSSETCLLPPFASLGWHTVLHPSNTRYVEILNHIIRREVGWMMRIRLPSCDEVRKIPLHYPRKSNIHARCRLAGIVKGIRKVYSVDCRGNAEFVPEAGITACECLSEKVLVATYEGFPNSRCHTARLVHIPVFAAEITRVQFVCYYGQSCRWDAGE